MITLPKAQAHARDLGMYVKGVPGGFRIMDIATGEDVFPEEGTLPGVIDVAVRLVDVELSRLKIETNPFQLNA